MQTVSMVDPRNQGLHPAPRRCPLGNIALELILLLVGGCRLAAGNP